MDRRSFGVSAGPVVLAAELFGVTACVLVLVWCIHYRGGLSFHVSNEDHFFNLHPVFMFVGFIFLASQGILVYKIIPARKELQKVVHLVLHGVAIITGAIGLYVIFKLHNESHNKNLYSLHSWLGIGAISLFGLQWLVGFVTFFFPGASKWTRASVVPWHVFLGIFVYIMAITAAETGILELLTKQGLEKFGSEAMLVNSTGLIIFFFAMFVVLSTILPRD